VYAAEKNFHFLIEISRKDAKKVKEALVSLREIVLEFIR
jgi:hypothetical protein